MIARDRARRRTWSRPAIVALFVCVGASACATALEDRPRLPDPSSTAGELARLQGRDAPAFLRFQWSYADDRGDVRGEGAGRYNPPDSVRLDLFTSGDASMAVALAGGRLTSRESIEDVRLPDAPFLWAMAGFFQPPNAEPVAGYRTPEGRALRYRLEDDTLRDFHFQDRRLVRVEERVEGHLVRRVAVEWEDGPWPARAAYRNFAVSRRVRWTLVEVRHPGERYPARIYELPSTP